MTDATRRSLRTLYQGVLGFVLVVPLLIAALPTDNARIAQIAAAVVAVVAVVTKVVNVLEDAGKIPNWLKEPANSRPGDKRLYRDDRGSGDIDLSGVLMVVVLVALIYFLVRVAS